MEKKNFYADCEFDGFGGKLLSVAFINEENSFLFLVNSAEPKTDPWVLENLPDQLEVGSIVKLLRAGVIETYNPHVFPKMDLVHHHMAMFFNGCTPNIIVDWPDDVKYISELLITGPGTMIDIPGVTFEVKRVDPYPTKIPGAIQHNALWDAYVLKEFLKNT